MTIGWGEVGGYVDGFFLFWWMVGGYRCACSMENGVGGSWGQILMVRLAEVSSPPGKKGGGGGVEHEDVRPHISWNSICELSTLSFIMPQHSTAHHITHTLLTSRFPQFLYQSG